LALLDGEPGVGKTLVAIRLLDDLKSKARPVLLPSSRFTTPAEMYRTILFDLDLPTADTSETAVRLAVYDTLLKTASEGSKTVLVLDEAQHLSPWLLEELRLLDNLECKTGKVLFTVLVGLPELRDHIRGSLAQRICTRPTVLRFTLDESLAYLKTHLDALHVWDEEGGGILAEVSAGVPRVLNQLATAALSLAEDAVDVETALMAVERLGLVAPQDEPGQTVSAARSPVENPPSPVYPAQPPGANRTKIRKRKSA
jgi:general secretion pathway protein A